MEGLILQRTINTIEIMENTSLAVDSRHFHAFQHVPGAISNSIVFRFMTQRQSCCICEKKLSPFLFSYNQNSNEKNGELASNSEMDADGIDSSKKSSGIVKCVACGVFVHRDCLARASCSSSSRREQNKLQVPVCVVNQPLVAESMKKHYDYELSEFYDDGDDDDDDESDDDDNDITMSSRTSNCSRKDSGDDKKKGHITENTIENQKYTSAKYNKVNIHEEYAEVNEQSLNSEKASIMPPPYPILLNQRNATQNIDDCGDSNINVWTSNGPPTHWALHHPDVLHRLNEEIQGPKNDIKNDQDDVNDATVDTSKSIQYNFESSFSQVSQLLQDHILSIIPRQKDKNKQTNNNLNNGSNADNDEKNYKEVTPMRESNLLNEFQKKLSIAEEDEEAIAKSLKNEHQLLKEEMKDPISSPLPIKERNLRENLRVAHKKYKQLKQTKANVTAVTVAGSIAGGVAGLFVAGPAGAYMGIRLGQACGSVLGISGSAVLVYSSVAAISAAGAGTIVHSKKKQENIRMLTLGEEGIKQKMMLVRPDVEVPEEWEHLCLQLRREWCSVYHSPKQNSRNNDIQRLSMNGSGNAYGRKKISPLKGGVLNSIIQNMNNSEDQSMKNRDDDILGTDESEIGLSDKILLLVNRSLNDKNSQPAYIYRGLIKEFRIRNQKRKTLQIESPNQMNNSADDLNKVSRKEPKLEENLRNNIVYSRERRQDAHGVIKFVTATLLDFRPNFGRTQALTEMSATAVEDLVFGEIYDEIFEEILDETAQRDNVLMNNILAYEKNKNCDPDQNEMLSLDALRALRDLCESHSPADKLACCVDFLESISAKFSSALNTTSSSANLGADTLLKLVCQHVIAAKIPRLNAETLFIDEFARDEQLLKGKEGYALITLQAALHFLNSKDNVESVLFS